MKANIDVLCKEFGVQFRDACDVLYRAGEKYGMKLIAEDGDVPVMSAGFLDFVLDYKKKIERELPSWGSIHDLSSSSVPFRESKWLYYLMNDSDLIYIGITTNPARRMGEHVKTKPVNRVYCVESKNHELLEYYAINEYKPELNQEIPDNKAVLEATVFRCAAKFDL